MGFPAYMLIVAEFINWSKDNEIPVGPGRGSAAGSIVSRCASHERIVTDASLSLEIGRDRFS